MAIRIKNLKDILDSDSEISVADDTVIILSSEDDRVKDSKIYPIFQIKNKIKKISKKKVKHELLKKLSTISISDNDATTSKPPRHTSNSMESKYISTNTLSDNDTTTSKPPRHTSNSMESKHLMCKVCELRPATLKTKNYCRVCHNFFKRSHSTATDKRLFSKCLQNYEINSENCLDITCSRCRYEKCLIVDKEAKIFPKKDNSNQDKCQICENPVELSEESKIGKPTIKRKKQMGLDMCQACRSFTHKFVVTKKVLEFICTCSEKNDLKMVKITKSNRLECNYCRYYHLCSIEGIENPNEKEFNSQELDLIQKFRNKHFKFEDLQIYRESNYCDFCKKNNIEAELCGYDTCYHCKQMFYININSFNILKEIRPSTSEKLKPYIETGFLDKYRKIHAQDNYNFSRFEENHVLESDDENDGSDDTNEINSYNKSSEKIYNTARNYNQNKIKLYNDIKKNLNSPDLYLRQLVTALDLMTKTSIRPGFSSISGKGMFTLDIDDIKLNNNDDEYRVTFDFIGKSNIRLSNRSVNICEQTFENLKLYQTESTNNKLFQRIYPGGLKIKTPEYNRIRTYISQIIPHLSCKVIRTSNASEMFQSLIYSESTNGLKWKEKIDFITDCFKAVSEMLNHNTVYMTAKYYIDPRILAHWSHLNNMNKSDFAQYMVYEWGWVNNEEAYKF